MRHGRKRATLVAAVVVLMWAVAGVSSAATQTYPNQTLSGGYQAGHFNDVWDLTAGDMTLSFTYNATGLSDAAGGHAWAELGVRSLSSGATADFNPYLRYTYPTWTTNLLAGQNTDVGDVIVTNDGTNLYVTYALVDGWCMTESHLAVATTKAAIPHTKKGNPIPGQFAYGDYYDPCVTSDTFTIASRASAALAPRSSSPRTPRCRRWQLGCCAARRDHRLRSARPL